jgi:hypothetical protein
MENELGQLFLKYDYAETKDLSKQFLTLVVAVLVFSLTFSEKIVEFRHASTTTRTWLVGAWTAFILSIVLCGLGLVFISFAGSDAAYFGSQYQRLAVRAYWLIFFAGCAFVAGLTALVITAIVTVYSRKSDNADAVDR